MSAKDKFTARRDAGTAPTVLLTKMSRQNTADLIAAANPPLIVGVSADEQAADFSVNLNGKLNAKRFRISVLNAEKYRGSAALREELLLDLTETVRARNGACRLGKNIRESRAGFSRPVRSALLTALCFLGVALAAFAAVVGILRLSELPQLAAFLPQSGAGYTAAAAIAVAVAALSVGAYLVCRLPRRKASLRDREHRLQRALVSGRNAHLRHVVLVKNAGRLDGYTQLALYNALSSLLDYNPLTFLLLLNDQSQDNFRTYFRDLFPTRPTATEPPARQLPSPAVRAILGNKSVPLPPKAEKLPERRKLPEPAEEQISLEETRQQAISAAGTPAAIERRSAPRLLNPFERPEEAPEKSPEKPVPGQIDLLKDIPKAEPPAFDFAGSTSKDVLHAMSSGTLSGFPGFEILYGALPKIARMPEKTLNEYLTVLSYTVRTLDLTQTDFSRVDNRIWTKFVGWYRDMNQVDSLMPLYRKALSELNTEILFAFLPALSGADSDALSEALEARTADCFETDAPFNALIPLLAELAKTRPEIVDRVFAGTEQLANDISILDGKANFTSGFALLLGGFADRAPDSALDTVYLFLSSLLGTFEDPELIGAGMRLVADYKDKFRFHGLSIDTLNDIIFNRDFVDVEKKLDYIDSLLASPQLTDAEKNRYVNYLLGARDTLQPRFRLKVLQSLVRSGCQVERENVLEAVKWIRDDKSQDFLDELVRLLHVYSGVKGAKNDGVFQDLCRQPLSASERSRILRAYLTAGYQDAGKIAKALLKSCLTEDETLSALDYSEAVLKGLAALADSSRLPRPEFVETVCYLMENAASEDKFKSLLRLLAVKFYRVSLNGDLKSDLKSAMFKGAQKFDSSDFSVDTGVILKTFKIEYISFVEQKIAKQGDPDVEKRVAEVLAEIEKERE